MISFTNYPFNFFFNFLYWKGECEMRNQIRSSVCLVARQRVHFSHLEMTHHTSYYVLLLIRHVVVVDWPLMQTHIVYKNRGIKLEEY